MQASKAKQGAAMSPRGLKESSIHVKISIESNKSPYTVEQVRRAKISAARGRGSQGGGRGGGKKSHHQSVKRQSHARQAGPLGT